MITFPSTYEADHFDLQNGGFSTGPTNLPLLSGSTGIVFVHCLPFSSADASGAAQPRERLRVWYRYDPTGRLEQASKPVQRSLAVSASLLPLAHSAYPF